MQGAPHKHKWIVNKEDLLWQCSICLGRGPVWITKEEMKEIKEKLSIFSDNWLRSRAMADPDIWGSDA
jgi:hypothetical protein